MKILCFIIRTNYTKIRDSKGGIMLPISNLRGRLRDLAT